MAGAAKETIAEKQIMAVSKSETIFFTANASFRILHMHYNILLLQACYRQVKIEKQIKGNVKKSRTQKAVKYKTKKSAFTALFLIKLIFNND